MNRSSRRAFLKSAAAFASLAPVAGFPAVVKRRNLSSMLSHACVGTGNMALEDLRGLMAHKDLHVTALCDVDANFLAEAQKLCPDARVYRHALEMFAAEGDKIDSVNVSTPDHTHARYALDALKRGYNVYCQKPLCHDLADCRRLERLAAEKGAVTQMGTQIAAWECDRQTTDFLKWGVIGEVKHVWLFSNRRGKPDPDAFNVPSELPVPKTLDWKEWLGDVPYRPYAAGYHPGAWRKWRAFGTSWLGDLGLHVFSPVWMGLDLGTTGPTTVKAEVSDDGWTPAQKELFWPTVSHITWKFPGVKASGGKPFEVEWCDGFLAFAHEMEPRFMPPAFLQDVAAKSSYGQLPAQGRVVEGTEGWLLSTHFGVPPTIVFKNGKPAPNAPMSGPAPSHWADYVDCCLQGGEPRSSFAWTARMTEVSLLGNAAQAKPGVELKWDAEKGVLA